MNLTQHPFTQEQRNEIESKGYEIVEFDEMKTFLLKSCITFDTIPSQEEMVVNAETLVGLIDNATNYRYTGDLVTAMIGGAPFFQSTLERTLFQHGIRPCYSFYQQCTEDATLEDGSIAKKSIFKHIGFVLPPITF